MNLTSLSNEELARRCTEDTARFHLQQDYDTAHCFELLRRALGDGASDAFTRVYQIYEPQVLNWVHQHTRFRDTGESADFFANQALTNFYFALRGEKFGRFPTLAQVLSYLKLCVHSSIAGYLRKRPAEQMADLQDDSIFGYSANVAEGLHAAELWDHICALLPDADDQFLARCVFVLALKPARIAELYADRWATAREVSVALQRIRRNLRKDPALRRYAGIAAPDRS